MAGLELLSDQGFRIDGRRAHELRRIECRMGIFTQADGSAYIEQGNTKVVATVYGPHEIHRNKQNIDSEKAVINCEYSMATFSTGERKRRPRGDRKSLEMSTHLCQAFEAAIITDDYPQSQIDIFVEVLQADGGNYSACINAGILALVDAGIPIQDIVCGCSAGFVNEIPIVDISHLEETLGGTELNIAILPKTQRIVLQEMTSRLHHDHFLKVLDVAMKGCMDVYAILEAVIVSNYKQKMNVNLNESEVLNSVKT